MGLFFATFFLLLHGMGFVMLRHGVAGARHRTFTVGYWVAAALALAPWLTLGLWSWDAVDRVPAWIWNTSIAWTVSVTVLVTGWPVWRPLLGLLERAAARPGVDEARRELLKKLGWLVPSGALGLGSVGVVAAGLRPKVTTLTLHWPDLPEGLHGFKIGHFSDVHVGPFISPATAQAAVEALNEAKVDVQVMTGDLLDDVEFVPALNRVFTGVKAQHGLLGILGNHEHWVGIPQYMEGISKGPMKMLVNEGHVITHNGARLHVSGIDYPFRGMDGPAAVTDRFLDKALAGVQDGDFKLCLAHHPTCWDSAKTRGVHLTLSGHTHGGQVALGGKSVFAALYRYILGFYQDGPAKLFVTAGLGHWFPFRFGCPAEVVVVTLQRGAGPDVT